MAFRKNMEIPTGADWRETWTWWSDTLKTQAKNLTGWTGSMQLRSRHGSPTVLAEISTANGRMVLGAGEGNVAVHLPFAVVSALNPDRVVADCILTDPTGERHELFHAEPVLRAHATE